MKFAACEKYWKFINQFLNDSMLITCHSDISEYKNITKGMHNG